MWFKNYLAVVSRPLPSKFTKPSSKAVGTIALSIASSIEDANQKEESFNSTLGSVLTLYDLKNKYIAFSGSFGEEWVEAQVGRSSSAGSEKPASAIKCIASEWGELFIVTTDKKVKMRINQYVTNF